MQQVHSAARRPQRWLHACRILLAARRLQLLHRPDSGTPAAPTAHHPRTTPPPPYPQTHLEVLDLPLTPRMLQTTTQMDSGGPRIATDWACRGAAGGARRHSQSHGGVVQCGSTKRGAIGFTRQGDLRARTRSVGIGVGVSTNRGCSGFGASRPRAGRLPKAHTTPYSPAANV